MDATEYIQKLGLVPHPEGGYYRQLFGNDETGGKPVSTIYYMLTANDMSAFHRLHNMVEIWYFHAGEPLNIYVIDIDGTLTVHHLSEQNEMQVVIQPEQWFAAEHHDLARSEFRHRDSLQTRLLPRWLCRRSGLPFRELRTGPEGRVDEVVSAAREVDRKDV